MEVSKKCIEDIISNGVIKCAIFVRNGQKKMVLPHDEYVCENILINTKINPAEDIDLDYRSIFISDEEITKVKSRIPMSAFYEKDWKGYEFPVTVEVASGIDVSTCECVRYETKEMMLRMAVSQYYYGGELDDEEDDDYLNY